eukprot:1188456-Amphidinium_carterae.4
MRSLYQNPESDNPALDLFSVVKVPPEPIFTAFKHLIRHPAQRYHMALHCKTSASLSKAEAIVAAQALKQLRPHGSGDQYETGLEIMKLFWRVRADLHHPEIVYSMSGDCYADLQAVVRSSSLGEALFMSSLKALAAEYVYTYVEERVLELNTPNDKGVVNSITKDTCVEWLRITVANLKSIEGQETLANSRRKWILLYRGVKLEVLCKTPERFAELSLKLAVRQVEIAQKENEQLHPEVTAHTPKNTHIPLERCEFEGTKSFTRPASHRNSSLSCLARSVLMMQADC